MNKNPNISSQETLDIKETFLKQFEKNKTKKFIPKQTNTFLDLIVDKKQSNLEDDIVFCSNIFALFGLPTRKTKENIWSKENILYKFKIINAQYSIPYGAYARMNQIFIDTEIVQKQNNVIDLGNSFNDYIKKLGLKEGKANKTAFQQLINYITSIITIEVKNNDNRLIGANVPISRQWNIFFDKKNSENNLLFNSTVILDEDYANYVINHAVPLDMNLIRIIKNNPLALDFYRYLVYRTNKLNKEISFPDRLLFEHLGTNNKNNRDVRQNVKHILKLIKQYWHVNADFQDGYFILKPSPPAVQKSLK